MLEFSSLKIYKRGNFRDEESDSNKSLSSFPLNANHESLLIVDVTKYYCSVTKNGAK